jgi:thiol-disulfide isomerase/thioredoxin
MRNLRTLKYWPWLRDGALILSVVLAIRLYQQRDLPRGAAPVLSGADLAGTPVSLADYRGKPVLLHFWATWCGVCRAEQSSIDALARDLPVLTVASQSGGPQEVGRYVEEHGVVPRVLIDPTSALATRYGVRSFPTTFVLDSHGDIRFREVGYTTQLGMRARMWLASL